MIDYNHRNRSLLFHQFQPELFFDRLEDRYAAGRRRVNDRPGRLIRTRTLRCLQQRFGRPSNQKIPPALKAGGIHDRVIDISVGLLLPERWRDRSPPGRSRSPPGERRDQRRTPRTGTAPGRRRCRERSWPERSLALGDAPDDRRHGVHRPRAQIIVPAATKWASRRGTRSGMARAWVTKKVVGIAAGAPRPIARQLPGLEQVRLDAQAHEHDRRAEDRLADEVEAGAVTIAAAIVGRQTKPV